MSMEKKEEDFDYLAEQAKQSFQANINSLMELVTYLDQKRVKAVESKKDGAFFANSEIQVLKEWIMEATAKLQGDYVSLDRTNRYTNKLWRCAITAAEATKLRTPSLKRLLA